MKMNKIIVDMDKFPTEIQALMEKAVIYDSSSSPQAKVYFIERDCGYFLKVAKKGSLKREFEMTQYFNSFGIATKVLTYISNEKDFFVSEKLSGADCIAEKYLCQPERLCDTIAEHLEKLHSLDFSTCPIQNHTERYLKVAEAFHKNGNYNKEHFPDSYGYASADEAWQLLESKKHLLKTDTLLHGDYCLPNIILKDWNFSGFIDLDNAGVGDRHVDIFWALWSLEFNLKTSKFRQRFIDAYGRDEVDEEMLKVVAAVEVFDE